VGSDTSSPSWVTACPPRGRRQSGPKRSGESRPVRERWILPRSRLRGRPSRAATKPRGNECRRAGRFEDRLGGSRGIRRTRRRRSQLDLGVGDHHGEVHVRLGLPYYANGGGVGIPVTGEQFEEVDRLDVGVGDELGDRRGRPSGGGRRWSGPQAVSRQLSVEHG
jgi:hypothetical protein